MHPDHMAFFQSWVEILRVEGRRNGIDVAAQLAPGEPQREKYRPPAGWINGIVDAVVGVGGSDGAGADAAQRVGPAHTLKIDIREVVVRSGGYRLDIRNVVAVG